MINIVIDKPYEFIPPRVNRFWLWVARRMVGRQLLNDFGVSEVECRGQELLRASLEAGNGVMLVGNHCRPCDPLVMDALAREVRRPFHTIASWHVFMESRVKRFLLPRIGAFSVYREGMDRESLKSSVKTMVEGRHPLVIFAEGIISRSNDRLLPFMDGPAFMARTAAKQRSDGRVMVHPVFIRYFFEGDLQATVEPVVAEIESRLSWQPGTNLPLLGRISRVGMALLALKEIEYLGAAQQGAVGDRLERLVDRLLEPLEGEWCGGRHDGDPMARVKRLRTAILPDLVGKELAEDERARRWRHLADLYLVQQLWCYPGDYIAEPTPERVLETVERFEEDLTDLARAHPPIRAVVTVGEGVVVEGARERGRAEDPLITEVRRRMEGLMEESKSQRRSAPDGA
ncbi:MAG: 1-acyl-sn-glycerol-3-phosphate acyltransferase [Akkermansiaceae bacterium]|nr:1-acyl-sn-glycerol-3-phosphate acyltransferase [Akkermansiaceae bacterium]MCF7734238.1 1-acyl-sn-glycerol-3-phosphate acyltransferase [Akkermansiaceae bacterium]